MKSNIKMIILIIAILMVAFSVDTFSGFTTQITKIWSYTYTPANYKWTYKYHDEWGGHNSQCTSPGNVCGRYDWRAVYTELQGIEPQDPCPGNNNPQYGHNLVVAESGSEAPPYLPSFSMFWE